MNNRRLCQITTYNPPNMPLLDQDQYNLVVEDGKAAVQAANNKNPEAFLQKAESGWDKFPEPKDNWNQGYNYAKMIFKHLINFQRFADAKIWLDRMIANEKTLGNFGDEPQFYTGIYHFETGDYEQALKLWQEVVKNAGMRYFEGQKKEYSDFYVNPLTLIKA